MNILFWSGGKDAYLALEFFRLSNSGAEIQLLTTYEESTERVPHQQIALHDIKEQALFLGLELMAVPLPANCSNETYLKRVEEALRKIDGTIEYLLFGDLYVESIRQWREKVFGEMGFKCLFPLWGKSMHELLPVLFLKPVEVKISAVKDEFQSLIRVGERYDQSFVAQLQHLPQKIDPMGENGEFHTRVTFKHLNS